MIKNDIVLANYMQLRFAFVETSEPEKRYEYAVPMMNLPYDIYAIVHIYHDRADAENCFDKHKNQWGWGGYTTQDLKHCRVASRTIALAYK